MNNKYSVACTLVRDKYTVRLQGAPCSSLDGVTACVVYTADSIRKFDSKSNRTAYSIRDSIITQKNNSQVPSEVSRTLNLTLTLHITLHYSISTSSIVACQFCQSC